MRWIQAILLGCVLTLSGCGGSGSSAPPPQGFSAVAGDSQVVLDWTAEAGVEYWVLYAPGSTVDALSWTRTPGGNAIVKVQPPYTLGGLVNGVQYAFAVNARRDGGPGGDATPSVALTPRPAGDQWTALQNLGSARLQAAAYGLVSTAIGTRLLVGGEDGVLRSSVDGSTWTELKAADAPIRVLTIAYGKVLIAGAQGMLAHSSDLAAFTRVSSGVSTSLNAMATGGGRTLAVGEAGVMLSTTDGSNWSRLDSGTTLALHGIVYSPAGYWIAVGDQGLVLRSTDGNSWSRIEGTGAQAWNAVTVLAVTETVDGTATLRYRLVTVGPQGRLATSADGLSWQVSQLPDTPELTRVIASSGTVIAVGSQGAVRISSNALNWRTPDVPAGGDLWALVRFGNTWRAFGSQGRHLGAR